MEFSITCNKGRKHIDSQMQGDMIEAVKFCNDCKTADNFMIHPSEKNWYLKGTKVTNEHIDWVKVPLEAL